MLGENREKLELGGNFEAFPSGKYTLQVADVNNAMESYMGGPEEPKFKFTFVVLNDIKFKAADGKELTARGRKLWKSFSKFVSAGANLFKFIRILDPEFEKLAPSAKENYNLDSLVGKQIDALVSKTQSKKDASVYYNNIKEFEKCETELEGFKDLPGKPTVINTQSVPVTAPPAPEATAESAEDFVNSLEKENKASGVAEKLAQAKAEAAK